MSVNKLALIATAIIVAVIISAIVLELMRRQEQQQPLPPPAVSGLTVVFVSLYLQGHSLVEKYPENVGNIVFMVNFD